MGLQDVFFQLRLPFDAPEARALSRRIAGGDLLPRAVAPRASWPSEQGAHPAFAETRAARGELQFDAWGVDARRRRALGRAARSASRRHGLRNSLLIAIAPTATIASIAGCYECIEPQVSNLFKRETLSGDFLQVNRYLVDELKALGLWTEAMRTRLKLAEGSVQELAELPEELRAIYRTAWELPMRSLIDMAADRGAFIDQSQSLNLFIESPNIGQLSSMYFYAWKQGPEDDVLPALAPGDAHRQGHGRDARRRAEPAPPTRRRSPARSRTRRAARPASERTSAGPPACSIPGCA